MAQLRMTGVGNQGGAGRNTKTSVDLSLVVRKWAEMYNKHNPSSKIQYGQVIEIDMGEHPAEHPTARASINHPVEHPQEQSIRASIVFEIEHPSHT